MKIRFNTEAAACVFKNEAVSIELKACDQSDLIIFAQRPESFKIPSTAWEDYEENGIPMRRINYGALSDDQLRALQFDDDRFIGSRIVSISGFENEDDEPVSIDDIPAKSRGDFVTLVKQTYPEFTVWCQVYILGAKKKSGVLEII